MPIELHQATLGPGLEPGSPTFCEGLSLELTTPILCRPPAYGAYATSSWSPGQPGGSARRSTAQT